jgi:SM-20-related protein
MNSRVGISDHFLSKALALHLQENLILLHSGNRLKSAGIGDDNHVQQNLLVRSDKIFWLDRTHDDQYENEFFDLMDQFVSYLNRSCYTGITGYEFHYTFYQEGSFYKRHLDQFADSDSRQYSMVMYLNQDWKPDDGGELRIYQGNVHQNVAPESGKGVFFKSSELEHEVMPAVRPRLSITGWLKINSHLAAISVDRVP